MYQFFIVFFVPIIGAIVQTVSGLGAGVISMLAFPSAFGMVASGAVSNSVNLTSPALIK